MMRLPWVSDASGNLSISSDSRLKIIQGNFTTGLSAVMGLEPALYKWNELSGLETNGIYAGFIAQNVKQYIPEAVGIDPRGYFTLSDRPIIAALVNAMKEQQKMIEYLTAVQAGLKIENGNLKISNETLNTKFTGLEAMVKTLQLQINSSAKK